MELEGLGNKRTGTPSNPGRVVGEDRTSVWKEGL